MHHPIVSGCLLTAGLILTLVSESYSAPKPVPGLVPRQQLLLDIALPPLGIAPGDATKMPTPDLKGTSLKKYPVNEKATPAFEKAVREAQLVLWATSPLPAPAGLNAEVVRVRREMKFNPKILITRFPIPVKMNEERRFKEQLVNASREAARAVAQLEEVCNQLRSLEDDRDKQPLRWQANQDLMLAAVQIRLVALEEYSAALGRARKELPPHTLKTDKAIQLEPKEKAGDFASKKWQKSTRKILDRLAREHAGTVWEGLARHLKDLPVGVEWKAVP